MENKKFARLELQLDPALKQQLREKTKKEGVLMSTFVRNLLIKNLLTAA